jgi:hypothetical protein
MVLLHSISYFLCNIGTDIQLQEKLISQDYHNIKPDKEFLEPFAGVVGSEWPSLAASLSLSDDEIEEVRRAGGSQSHDPQGMLQYDEKGDTIGVLSQQGHALLMLKKWASTGESATYGQLFQALKTIPLFPIEYIPLDQPPEGNFFG